MRKTASNSKDIKILNRLLVRETIRQLGPIARYEVANETGLAAPTVSVIVNELIAEGVVEETGRGESSGGRRPVMLEISPTAAFILAVRIQRGETATAIFDLSGNALNEHYQTLDTSLAEDVVQAIGASFDWLADSTGIDRRRILWCGLASPGLIDSHRGIVERSSNLRWEKVALGAMLSKRLYGMPVHVENISNAAALAEHEFGNGRGSKSLIYINLSVGIGAGIVLNNEVYGGCRGYAGEIGHMTLIPDGGPECTCGSSGCFEALCGISAVLEQAKQAVSDDVLEQLGLSRARLSFDSLLYPPLSDRAEIRQVMRRVGRLAGVAVSNLVNMLNPDTVILGGELARLGSSLVDMIADEMRIRVLSELNRNVRVAVSSLKEDPPLKGSYAAVANKIFDMPDWFG